MHSFVISKGTSLPSKEENPAGTVYTLMQRAIQRTSDIFTTKRTVSSLMKATPKRSATDGTAQCIYIVPPDRGRSYIGEAGWRMKLTVDVNGR
jgi:hypothetical protein